MSRVKRQQLRSSVQRWGYVGFGHGKGVGRSFMEEECGCAKRLSQAYTGSHAEISRCCCW